MGGEKKDSSLQEKFSNVDEKISRVDLKKEKEKKSGTQKENPTRKLRF